MADARLDDLLQAYGVARATQWTSGGPLDEIESARAAIVAHVREREVELMGLCKHSGFHGTSPQGATIAVRVWREFRDLDTEWIESARALRDAFDQAGGKGATDA